MRFYTTVGTPLDQFHGADAIMELNQEGKEPVRIRLGATTVNNAVKSERQSKPADLEIEERWLNLEDGLNKQKIPELARQIVSQFEEKMATKER